MRTFPQSQFTLIWSIVKWSMGIIPVLILLVDGGFAYYHIPTWTQAIREAAIGQPLVPWAFGFYMGFLVGALAIHFFEEPAPERAKEKIAMNERDGAPL